jgi:hypothetical protein
MSQGSVARQTMLGYRGSALGEENDNIVQGFAAG